ncbi:hypothetical protein BJ170DRAFT_384835 [Xylariales sp. AK1849]|nr:hypothetical protein BJ170DRAFT_384835 [Xylariales sp. AK1849]
MGMDGFNTPHRPAHRVTKPQHRGERPQPWTASRCHRLLRPLLSRIALLRKDILSAPVQHVVATETQQDGSARRPAEDCSWLLPRKKVRRTYSQRGADRPRCEPSDPEAVRYKAAKDLQYDDSAHGQIVAITPLLRRARGQQLLSSPVKEIEPGEVEKPVRRKRGSGGNNSGARLLHLGHRLAALRAQVSPARYADYDAIYRGLEALLKVTMHGEGRNRGASSLLSMCLRKVPEYVAGVQAWELHEAETEGTRSAFETSDVPFRIYSELESVGISANGWMPLRTVTRADALRVIQNAMAEGLFTDEFSMLLIDLCAEYGASEEVDGLMKVLVCRQWPEPGRPESLFSENAQLGPLSFLRDFSTKTGRTSFLLRQYSHLLVEGFLPCSWLATHEFEQVWGLTYRILSRGLAALDAVDFLVTAVVLSCRRQEYNNKSELRDISKDMVISSQQTITKTLAIVSSMKLLGENESQIDGDAHVDLDKMARISRSLTYTLQACVVENELWQGTQGKLGRELLSLAIFLSSTMQQDEQITICLSRVFNLASNSQDSTGSIEAIRAGQHYDSMISLIASVAKVCGRGTSHTSREYLEGLCKQLGRLGLQNVVIKSINKAAAFVLAQQTNDLLDLIYAEKLASNPMHPGDDQRGLGAKTLLDGYRWEEAIGEWVTVSPVVTRNPPKRRSLRSSAVFTCSRANVGSALDVGLSPTRSTSLTSLVTEIPTSQRRNDFANVETSDNRRKITTNRDIGQISPTHHTLCETRSPQYGTTLDDGKCSRVPSKNTTLYDELGDDDKENRCKVAPGRKVRKRHSHSTRTTIPLDTRRVCRYSGSDYLLDTSDDELAV